MRTANCYVFDGCFPNFYGGYRPFSRKHQRIISSMAQSHSNHPPLRG